MLAPLDRVLVGPALDLGLELLRSKDREQLRDRAVLCVRDRRLQRPLVQRPADPAGRIFDVLRPRPGALGAGARDLPEHAAQHAARRPDQPDRALHPRSEHLVDLTGEDDFVEFPDHLPGAKRAEIATLHA